MSKTGYKITDHKKFKAEPNLDDISPVKTEKGVLIGFFGKVIINRKISEGHFSEDYFEKGYGFVLVEVG